MNQTIQVSLHSDYPWERIKQDTALFALLETAVLPPYFNNCRWFAGKARTQRHFRLQTVLEIPTKETKALLCMVEVLYDDQATETYLLPLSFIEATQAQEITPVGIIALAYLQGKRGFLIDALYDTGFQQALFYHVAHAEAIAQPTGKVDFVRGKGLAGEDINTPISSKALTLSSSNSAMIFGEKYFMKLYRKLFHEANPEVEMIEFLTEYSEFAFIPAFAGSLTWRPEGMPEITLGMMQRVVDNQSDSWEMIGKELNDFVAAFTQKTFAIEEQVFDQVELLAQRTAEMHLALYAPEATPLFASEVFTPAYRSFLHKRLSHLLDSRYHLLIEKYTSITDPVTRKLAWDFMEAKELIDEFAGQILTKDLQSLRVRIHGDYHLGQVLATGNDYIIIDFEGEPESSITDRKIKHSPLKDVAGMIRSYHYAISAKMFNDPSTIGLEASRVQTAADRWYKLMLQTFMEKYLDTFGHPHPLFKNNNEINFLLLIYLLEKAVYELGYEISYRPDWVKIPLKGIVNVIREIEKLKM